MSEYIEREKALDAVVAWAEICPSTAISEIECMTAADVAPVVHGRWIYSRTESEMAVDKCSICEKEQFAISGVVSQGNYCPNCGCKMDGGEKHE